MNHIFRLDQARQISPQAFVPRPQYVLVPDNLNIREDQSRNIFLMFYAIYFYFYL